MSDHLILVTENACEGCHPFRGGCPIHECLLERLGKQYAEHLVELVGRYNRPDPCIGTLVCRFTLFNDDSIGLCFESVKSFEQALNLPAFIRLVLVELFKLRIRLEVLFVFVT